ncbi:alpha/beta fold hydrolase [Nocardia fluminea]
MKLENKTIEVGDIELPYKIFNASALETVVLLHGFPQDFETWRPIAESLSDRFRVVVPVQRGYSKQSMSNCTYSYRIENVRADIEQILQAESIHSVHIVGHDWGGSIAWSLARERPDLVKSLFVVSMPEPRALARSFLGVQLIKSWYIFAIAIPLLPELLLIRLWNGRVGVKILTGMGLDITTSIQYVRSIASIARIPSGPFKWYRALPFNLSELTSRKRVQAPTVHVWGSEDAAVAKRGIELSRQWVDNYELRILEGATHWIPEQQASQLSDMIAEHIGRNS